MELTHSLPSAILSQAKIELNNKIIQQTELENPDLRQQINIIGKLEDDKATMFFTIEKSEETTFEFLQNSVSIKWKHKNHKLVK